jgi:hypothetical protein
LLAFPSRSLLCGRLEEKQPNMIIGKLGSKGNLSSVSNSIGSLIYAHSSFLYVILPTVYLSI